MGTLLAEDDKDALIYLESGNYNVAVFDIMMPVMDGITALKKLRASEPVKVFL